MECCAACCFARWKNGAEGGTRTPMGCPTRPSNVRVYQFHHFGMLFTWVTKHEGSTVGKIKFYFMDRCSAKFVTGTLFFHGRLRRVYRGEPVSMAAVPAMHNIKKSGLKLFGDRAGLA